MGKDSAIANMMILFIPILMMGLFGFASLLGGSGFTLPTLAVLIGLGLLIKSKWRLIRIGILSSFGTIFMKKIEKVNYYSGYFFILSGVVALALIVRFDGIV